MPHRSVIALAAFHFEGNLLFAPEMFHDVGVDRCLGDGGRANGKLAVIGDEQHAVEHDRLAGLSLKTINFQNLARDDPVLFSTSF